MKRRNEDAEMMLAGAEMSRHFNNPEQARLLTTMAGVFQDADETEHAVAPKTFKKLATADDTIRAKAWGVKL